MAHFCERRACYVCTATNKRLKGLVKHLHRRHWPVYRPPRGFGRRVGPAGLKAGKQLDDSVSLILAGGDPGTSSWHGKLAKRVIALLVKGGCHMMRPQVVVWSEKRGMATAVDILGRSRDKKTLYILELKYCSHASANLRATYKLAHPETPRMRGTKLANSMYNHHQMQLRETVRLFKGNYGIDRGTEVVAGVIVACGDGGVLFYKLKG